MIAPASDLAKHSAGVEDALGYSRDGATYNLVESLVSRGMALLWTNDSASGAITKVMRIENSGEVEAMVWLAWGSIEDLLPIMREIEEFYRELPVERLTVLGRPGWMRSPLVKELGYRTQHVLYEKEIGTHGGR